MRMPERRLLAPTEVELRRMAEVASLLEAQQSAITVKPRPVISEA